MDWTHGYFAKAGYTYGYYDETMPSRLYLAALLQGYVSPRTKFRYLDAGCGQGYNLVAAAIMHPGSEFVGIDFMPEHIAHGRALAARLGLSNVTFIEGDFTQLAEQPAGLGEFDYAVCHGISTWISPVVRAGLFKMVGAVLKPAGIFYNSYNTFPGWLGMSPFQHLVLLNQRHQAGHEALTSAIDTIKQLQQHAPHLSKSMTGLMPRINNMANQDPAYLVQEYNNQFWQPVYVSQMMGELARVKLSFLGTATIPEINDNILPQAVREMISKQKDPVLREQLIDYAVNQSFRRDLYIKGPVKPWAGQLKAERAGLRFVANPMAEPTADDKSYVFKGGAVEVSRQGSAFNKLFNQVASAAAGVSFEDIHKAWSASHQEQVMLGSLALLVHSRHLFIENPGAGSDKKTEHAVLGKLCDVALEGAPYKVLPVPRVGQAIGMSETKWALLRCHFKGLPAAKWTEQVSGDIRKLGLNFMKDGKVTQDPQVVQTLLKPAIEKFTAGELKVLLG